MVGKPLEVPAVSCGYAIHNFSRNITFELIFVKETQNVASSCIINKLDKTGWLI